MENIEELFNLCKLGVWEWDITKHTFNERGYFSMLRGSFDHFLSKIYVHDRENIEKSLLNAAANNDLFEKTFRIVIRPDFIKWVFLRGRVRSSSLPIMNGIIIGINDFKQNEENHHLHQLELIELLKHSFHNSVVSFLAHELTQPLMVINTYIGGCIHRLRSNKTDPQQLIDIMENIKQQSSLIGDKVHQLKDLQLEGRLDYREANIHEVIHESILLLSYELQSQVIKMNFDFQENLPNIKINKSQLKQVFYYLIKNRIEHAGFISFSIKTKKVDDNTIKVIIKDSNNKANRADFPDDKPANHLSSKKHGVMMELSLCRSIIEEHGGTLSTKSSATGSVYKFTLHG